MQSSPDSSFWRRPNTRLGRWAVGLAVVFVTLFLINGIVFVPAAAGLQTAPWVLALLPYFGLLVALSGLAAGLAALAAILRARERSWLVWLTVLPLAVLLFMLLGELLLPH